MIYRLLISLLSLVGLAGVSMSEEKSPNTGRVFEMRTYYTHPGRMDALHARFRDHTCKLFEKHGITIVGFWKPLDKTKAE
ncbi:MAG: NIPSNAP family protein, partial [Gemmataceae bacterium]